MSGIIKLESSAEKRVVNNSPQSAAPSQHEMKVSDLVQAQLRQPPAVAASPIALKPAKAPNPYLDPCLEILGMKGNLPLPVRRLIISYIPPKEINPLIERRQPHFPLFTPLLTNHINLSDPEVLKTYLAPQFQSREHLRSACEIAKRIYESRIRGLRGSTCGMAFPMDPEVLAFALQLTKDKTVMEIAGASGENSILLAFSGAKKVYPNELEPLELESFHELTKRLPPDVSERLEAIPGDCFDILRKKPELAHQVSLILCRNFFHFLPEKQQADFLQLLKDLLKPGGRVILTLNSVYSFSQHRKTFEQFPNATCFTTLQCLVTDRQQGGMPIANIFQHFSVCQEKESMSFTSFKNFYLYEREAGSKWKVYEDQFQQLDPKVQPQIKEAIKSHNDMIKHIKSGSVRILMNNNQLYNKDNFPALLKRAGFEVEFTFVMAQSGHLLDEEDYFKKGQQLGVIIRYMGNAEKGGAAAACAAASDR